MSSFPEVENFNGLVVTEILRSRQKKPYYFNRIIVNIKLDLNKFNN